MIGKKLGNYEIRAQIGQGGMGIVYEAYDHSLHRRVAIKVIPSHLARQPDVISRFTKEARAAARLNHPGIIEVYGIGFEEGIHFFVMEYLDGDPLEKILLEKEKLSCDFALQITLQVASALHQAHSQGFIHRDIKPSNIIIDRDTGRVKVTDFGIAKAIEGDTQFTASDVRLGTPRYMSPEQVQGEQLDGRSDIFSLGVVLFQMLTGKGPFGGESFLVIMRKIIEVEPELSPEDELEIPVEVRVILKKALAKKQEDRYQSARELIQDIESYQKGEPISGPGEVRKTRRWIYSGIAALVILGSIITYIFLYSDRDRGRSDNENRIINSNPGPESAEAYVDQAGNSNSQSDPQGEPLRDEPGRPLYEKAEEFWKNNPEARGAAISGFQEVIDSFPGSSWAKKANAMIQSIIREPELEQREAAKTTEEQQQAERKKTESDNLINMGIRAMVEKNWDGAIFAFDNAARVYNLTPEIKEQLKQAHIYKWRDEAKLAAEEKRTAQAIALYDQILEVSPEDLGALTEKKNLEEDLRKNKKTEDEFNSIFKEGSALVQSGKMAEAIPVLEKALVIIPSHRETEQLLRQAREEVDKMSRATLILKITPPEARIYIDDIFSGNAKDLSSLVTTPGRHIIKVTSPDYQTRSGTITLKGGKSKTVSFSLKKKAQLRPVVVY